MDMQEGRLAQQRPLIVIALHWASLLLVIALLTIVFVRTGIEDRATRLILINLHRGLGVTLGMLTIGRIIARIYHSPLQPTAVLSMFAHLAAGSVHVALYVFLLSLPILGWALTNAHGLPVSFFGLFNLPELVGRNEDLSDALGELHEMGAWIFIGLIGLHAAAALGHHFIARDNVLRAMIPMMSRNK